MGERRDERPANCRNRLRDEGKVYPRSGCAVCGNGGLVGCIYERGIVPPIPSSLRDWFAGQALAGLARDIGEDVTITRRSSIVSVAYEFADTMLAHRQKEPE